MIQIVCELWGETTIKEGYVGVALLDEFLHLEGGRERNVELVGEVLVIIVTIFFTYK